MDGAGKIAAGIVVAAVIAVVGFVGYSEFRRHRDIAEATEAFQQLSQQGQAMAQQFQQQAAADTRLQAEIRERARRARMLAPSERCVGGTVVQVNGSTYTQAIGPDGRPIACSGRYRL